MEQLNQSDHSKIPLRNNCSDQCDLDLFAVRAASFDRPSSRSNRM